MLADKGYSTRAIRTELRRRRIPATIPERRDQQAHRHRRGRRWPPTRLRRTTYRRRNIVERCFNQLEQFRAIATRYDKTTTSNQSMIDLVTLLLRF